VVVHVLPLDSGSFCVGFPTSYEQIVVSAVSIYDLVLAPISQHQLPRFGQRSSTGAGQPGFCTAPAVSHSTSPYRPRQHLLPDRAESTVASAVDAIG
jgi:hypothetical protein